MITITPIIMGADYVERDDFVMMCVYVVGHVGV